jgi:hypothetical protein
VPTISSMTYGGTPSSRGVFVSFFVS